jgi:glycosyltransferase involved in cell wall biosynthesis
LAPICSIERISKVYAFCESDGFNFNEKLSYITLPRFIAGIKPAFLSTLLRWFYEPLQLFIYSIKYRPDYINGVYTLPKGLNSFIVSFLTNTHGIISIIGGKEEIESEFRFPPFWKALNLFMLKHCWAITCKGKRDIEYLVKEGIDRKKIYVYNGGIDIQRFKSGIAQRKIDLLFAGKFDFNKGPFRILEMINKLISEIKDIQCVFLGDGNLKQPFEIEVIRLGLQNNVQCFGHVENPEYFYQQSKIFVLPSTNEGLSTAMLESMSCGCVPVVSDVGNMAEAVKNDKNGFIIQQYDDINSFTSCILKLLQDTDKWTTFSQKAISQVHDNYSYSVQANLFEKIIND